MSTEKLRKLTNEVHLIFKARANANKHSIHTVKQTVSESELKHALVLAWQGPCSVFADLTSDEGSSVWVGPVGCARGIQNGLIVPLFISRSFSFIIY